MRIIFISLSVAGNSRRDNITYNFIVKEMEELVRQGHDIYFFAEDLDKDVIINGIKYLSHDSNIEKIKLHRRLLNVLYLIKHFNLLWKLFICYPLRTLGLCGIERSLGRLIAKYNIDLIHSHFFYPWGECGVMSARDYDIPLVATLRGAELYSCRDLDYGAMLDSFFALTSKLFLKYIDIFTAPSHFLVNRLKGMYKIADEKVKYVPNGITLLNEANYPKKQYDKFEFITIGGFIKRKNIDILLTLFARLKDKNVELTIVGNGPLKNNFINKICDGCLDHIKIIDEIPKDELFNLIASKDCTIHPSLIEGMPNVVLESLALGVPCLVSDIPVHREIIREGINGFLFDPNNEFDLLDKLMFIVNNREKISIMKNECIESIKKYDLSLKIKSYIHIYNELLQKKMH